MKAQASIVPGLLLLAQIVGEEALKFEDWGRILVLRWCGAHDRSVSLSGCSRRHGRGNACSIAWSSLHVVVRSLFAPVEAIHKILHIDLSKHWSESRLRSRVCCTISISGGRWAKLRSCFSLLTRLMLMRGGRHY